MPSVADVRGVILDLRGNHGGDGDVAVEVAARFLPRGTEVCTYETRRGPERRITTWENPSRPRVPLAVAPSGTTWHGSGLQPDLTAEPGAAGAEDTVLKAARALLTSQPHPPVRP